MYGQLSRENYTINGRITSGNNVLMYASIGIVEKNVGTISDDQGIFKLEIPTEFLNEFLTISHIGFVTKKIKIDSILNTDLLKVELEEELISLDEVLIIAERKKKYKLKEFGNKKKHDLFFWLQDVDKGKGSEIVTLINPKNEILIKSVSLNILNLNEENFFLLLNIYDLDKKSKLPKNQLLKKQKIIESNQAKGWLKIDLTSERIIIDEPFYIGFQWINIDRPVPLIGGTSNSPKNSLIRYKVMGTWKKFAEWDIKIEAEVNK